MGLFGNFFDYTKSQRISNRTNELMSEGKFDAAIELCNEAIHINNQNSHAWANLGSALINVKRYEESLRATNEAIKINPVEATAWINRGTALVYLHKNNKAVESYNRAIEIAPNTKSFVQDIAQETVIFRNLDDLIRDIPIFIQKNNNFVTIQNIYNSFKPLSVGNIQWTCGGFSHLNNSNNLPERKNNTLSSGFSNNRCLCCWDNVSLEFINAFHRLMKNQIVYPIIVKYTSFSKPNSYFYCLNIDICPDNFDMIKPNHDYWIPLAFTTSKKVFQKFIPVPPNDKSLKKYFEQIADVSFNSIK
jgi:hypothetical protein